jgi:RNA polymerase sigma factor (sigma-70 family)
MAEDKSTRSWPGEDEQSTVEEMIRNRDSRHWHECRNHVQQRVRAKKNLPGHYQEEVVQEVMYKVARGLPHFRFGCALTTWLTPIIEHCIVDVLRKSQYERTLHIPLDEPPGEGDHEGEALTLSEPRSPEDVAITIDELRSAITALFEFADTYIDPARARIIIAKVFFEERTYEEAAIVAGCNAAVVGYVVRQAQSYARKKMRRNP